MKEANIIEKNLDTKFDAIRAKLPDVAEQAAQETARRYQAAKGPQCHNVIVTMGASMIKEEFENILSEMKMFKPSKKEWELIRDGSLAFFQISDESLFRIAGERSQIHDIQDDNNLINYWRESIRGMINAFVDAEISAINKEKSTKAKERIWDLLKILIGAAIGATITWFLKK